MRLHFTQITFILLLLFPIHSIAQDNIGIKFFGLSLHPKGEHENAFLMPNKLDENGYFVMNFGTEIMYEKFIYKDILSIKVIQAIYSDCAARLGGFSHIGLRAKIFKIGKHTLNGGIGPTLVFRRNWLDLEGYVNPNRFKGGPENTFQYLFLWYGGEFEYKYQMNEKLDFAISFVPGYPDLMSLAFGVNLRFN
ncbi:hypothetical protein ERX46_04750 [Brumimicrobium glaciale]|uniref:Outer membrane protein beta-barrel domain-containing protein n=1 Tax=Brumimicrobium glaciale TaxID=200475 RepID=A0A4Q4KPB8_9FLAO|nr:hypothetical protein [Brumimicrobium glaciale]RYM34687.1 hypothetical protein ERX46_04750 [Brumimicrobium glaciale]